MNAGAWLAAGLSVVKLLNVVLALAQEAQWKSLGRAEAIQEAANHVASMVKQAAEIRAEAERKLSDPAVLRDADGMQRD